MFEKQTLNYVIDKVQSLEAVLQQINQNYEYYFIKKQNQIAGYFAYKLRKKELFLSKLYIIASERKKGIGRQVIKHLVVVAQPLRRMLHHYI